MTTRYLPIALGAILFVIASRQDPLTQNGGYASDGMRYRVMADAADRGERIHGETPFVYRIGTVYAATALPRAIDQVDRFLLVNLAGGLTSIALALAWLRRFPLQDLTRWLLLFCYAGHWLGPIRHTLWYRPSTNTWGHASLLACMLLSRRPGWFALASGIGMAFRESVVFAALGCLLSRETRRAGIAGLVACLAVGALVRAGVDVDPSAPGQWIAGIGLEKTVRIWMWRKPVWIVLTGLCLAFGPLLILCAVHPIRTARGLPIWAWGTATLVIGSAAYGGSDTERLAFFAAPILMPAVGAVLEAAGPRLFPVFLVLQLWTLRLPWSTPLTTGTKIAPDWTLFVALGNGHDPRALFTIGPVPGVPDIVWSQYLTLFCAMVLWRVYSMKAARKLSSFSMIESLTHAFRNPIGPMSPSYGAAPAAPDPSARSPV